MQDISNNTYSRVAPVLRAPELSDIKKMPEGALDVHCAIELKDWLREVLFSALSKAAKEKRLSKGIEISNDR